MLMVRQVELINKHKFDKVILDKNSKTFVIYIATLEATIAIMLIYLLQANQVPAKATQLVTLQ